MELDRYFSKYLPDCYVHLGTKTFLELPAPDSLFDRTVWVKGFSTAG